MVCRPRSVLSRDCDAAFREDQTPLAIYHRTSLYVSHVRKFVNIGMAGNILRIARRSREIRV